MIVVNSILAGLMSTSLYYFSRYPSDEELNKAGITWGKFLGTSGLLGLVFLVTSIVVDMLL